MSQGAAGPAISVLIRTRDGGALLRRTVEAVLAQRLDPAHGTPEVVLLDSGSRDGVPASLASAGPLRLVSGEDGQPFSHPRSSNRAAEAARGSILVFLSQDARPLHPDWLGRLVAPLGDPSVAASFGRQVPDASTPALEARDLLRAYPARPPSPTVLSNACSALRRGLWREHPFDERLPLAEDLEWGLWARARGFKIAYVAEARVEHAHHYAPATLESRYRAEGRALAALGRDPLGGRRADRAWLSGLPSDVWAVLRSGRLAELPSALVYHRLMYRALAEGAAAQARGGIHREGS